jgi:hypothetical protein
MVRRALAGVVGAVLGLLPLVLVDVMVNNPGAMGELAPTSDQSLLLSGTALVGGLLLGGGVAGWIAGRTGGVRAGGVGGTVAAVLYAGSLISVILLGGSRGQQGLPYVQVHPIRSSAAILLVASVIIVISLIAGRVVSPAVSSAPQFAGGVRSGNARPMDARLRPQPPQPVPSSGWQPSSSRPREQMSAPHPQQSRSAPRYPR